LSSPSSSHTGIRYPARCIALAATSRAHGACAPTLNCMQLWFMCLRQAACTELNRREGQSLLRSDQ
jgi:hypothetical protein